MTERPPGYSMCVGCGRMFRQDSNAEMLAYTRHLCHWSDERLDREIAAIVARLEREAISRQSVATPWRHQYR